MGLNIFQQIDNFIPKLNDTFRVYIRWNENDELQELQSCIGFTIPQPKYKDEYQFYGNQAQRFLIPDYESFDDVKIELYEYNDLRIGQLVSKCLSYNYDFKNNYYINKFIYQLLIEILDNNFEKKVYTYDFRLIKLTNYENYELGTEANDPTKWTLSFSYMYFHQGNVNSLGSNIKIVTDPDFVFDQTPMNIDAYQKEIQSEYSSLLNNTGSSDNGSTPENSINLPSRSGNEQKQKELPSNPPTDNVNPPSGKYSKMTKEEQIAYLKKMLKDEISGKATNGHSRKEGNDNQVYYNAYDGSANETKMNYGYGNTYTLLNKLGADKLGTVKFIIKDNITINGVTYKNGDTVEFKNLTEANNALKVLQPTNNSKKALLVLEQSSADKLNDLVLNDLAKKMQASISNNKIEDVVDNMNDNAIMGMTHMIYGGTGTMNNVFSGLAKNKTDVLDSLQKNNGYLGTDYTEKHKKDKSSLYHSENKKTKKAMEWNRLDYMSARGKEIKHFDIA